LKELDDIIDLLEASIPANPAAPQNRKLANQLEHDLKRYFSQLQDMMPADKIEQLYYKYVKQE